MGDSIVEAGIVECFVEVVQKSGTVTRKWKNTKRSVSLFTC